MAAPQFQFFGVQIDSTSTVARSYFIPGYGQVTVPAGSSGAAAVLIVMMLS